MKYFGELLVEEDHFGGIFKENRKLRKSISRKEHTCTCGKVLKSRQALTDHIREKHTKDKNNLTCNYCGRSFKGMDKLNRHLKKCKKGAQ